MDKRLISVVIPTYLRPDALAVCVHSLLEGAAQPDEIIVVGRESDQVTRQLVESWRSGAIDVPGLRCAWVKVAGHIPPVEAGLHLATGELVAFIDDDVTVSHGWLPAILRHFSDPSVGVVGGRVVNPGSPIHKLRGKPGRVTWFGKTWGNVAAMDGEHVVEVDTVMEGNWVWRRAVLCSLHIDPVLNFDDAAMYGLDLCLQAKKLGYRVLYDPQALVYHHALPRAPELDRQQRPPRAFAYCRNYTYIMLKHLPRWRKPIFLGWWFGVGERAAVGLGAWVANALSGRKCQPGETRRSLAGKIEGIRLWLRRGSQRGLSNDLAS